MAEVWWRPGVPVRVDGVDRDDLAVAVQAADLVVDPGSFDWADQSVAVQDGYRGLVYLALRAGFTPPARLDESLVDAIAAAHGGAPTAADVAASAAAIGWVRARLGRVQVCQGGEEPYVLHARYCTELERQLVDIGLLPAAPVTTLGRASSDPVTHTATTPEEPR